jgi:formate/nitrite transporter FocA (FNT family)
MKNSLATFREAGSFIAGLLIGLSIAVPVTAMLIVEPNDWQTLSVFCAPIVFVLGLTLQVVVTTKPRRRTTAANVVVALAARSVELSH